MFKQTLFNTECSPKRQSRRKQQRLRRFPSIWLEWLRSYLKKLKRHRNQTFHQPIPQRPILNNSTTRSTATPVKRVSTQKINSRQQLWARLRQQPLLDSGWIRVEGPAPLISRQGVSQRAIGQWVARQRLPFTALAGSSLPSHSPSLPLPIVTDSWVGRQWHLPSTHPLGSLLPVKPTTIDWAAAMRQSLKPAQKSRLAEQIVLPSILVGLIIETVLNPPVIRYQKMSPQLLPEKAKQLSHNLPPFFCVKHSNKHIIPKHPCLIRKSTKRSNWDRLINEQPTKRRRIINSDDLTAVIGELEEPKQISNPAVIYQAIPYQEPSKKCSHAELLLNESVDAIRPVIGAVNLVAGRVGPPKPFKRWIHLKKRTVSSAKNFSEHQTSPVTAKSSLASGDKDTLLISQGKNPFQWQPCKPLATLVRRASTQKINSRQQLPFTTLAGSSLPNHSPSLPPPVVKYQKISPQLPPETAQRSHTRPLPCNKHSDKHIMPELSSSIRKLAKRSNWDRLINEQPTKRRRLMDSDDLTAVIEELKGPKQISNPAVVYRAIPCLCPLKKRTHAEQLLNESVDTASGPVTSTVDSPEKRVKPEKSPIQRISLKKSIVNSAKNSSEHQTSPATAKRSLAAGEPVSRNSEYRGILRGSDPTTDINPLLQSLTALTESYSKQGVRQAQSLGGMQPIIAPLLASLLIPRLHQKTPVF